MGSVTSGSSSERHSLSGFVAPSSRNKRHVFAYDSSMGSTSMGSGSIATGASSVVPSEYEHGSRSLDSADKFAFLSELEAAAGGLQPLAETEEEQDDLATLRFQHAVTRLEQPAVLREKRRLIARLHTILGEKEAKA